MEEKSKKKGKHKVLKIIGIVILVLILGIFIKNKIVEISPWLKDDYYKDFKSDSKLEKKYSGIGEYEVSEKVYKVDGKVKNIRVWYPTE